MSGADRAAHLRETAGVLWPAPLRWQLEPSTRRPGPGLVDEYLVVPNASAPRLLLPAPPRLAGAVARRLPDGDSRGARGRTRLLRAALRLGASRLLLRDRLRVYDRGGAGGGSDPGDSITRHLSQLLGQRVQIAMPVTRPRANRKPVLRVVDGSGVAVAFVKVGTNALTRELVLREAAALGTLGERDLGPVVVPRVLARHHWGDAELLVAGPAARPAVGRAER